MAVPGSRVLTWGPRATAVQDSTIEPAMSENQAVGSWGLWENGIEVGLLVPRLRRPPAATLARVSEWNHSCCRISSSKLRLPIFECGGP